jgi:predicted RNase H-like nuclease (RuvC/YqgF family)
MDDDELYGDLELAAKQADLDNARAELEQTRTENEQLKTEVNQLRSQMQLLVGEKESLEKNCLTIYRTAMREIGRKDNEIKELRAQVVRLTVSTDTSNLSKQTSSS